MPIDSTRPWLSQYSRAFAPAEALAWNSSLALLLQDAAEHSPQAVAVLGDKTLTYADLYAQARHFASGLERLNFGQGCKIALMLPNMPEALIAFWGITLLGGIIIMVNPLYKEKELVANLNNAGAEALVLYAPLYPKIAPYLSRLPIRLCILSDDTPHKTDSLLPWRAVMENDGIFTEPKGICGETTLLLQYTGGTTGTSKGVELTHGNMGANALQTKHFFNLSPEDHHIFLSILPFFHVYGLSLGIIEPVAIHAATLPLIRFDPRETLKTIARFKPTIFPSAPAMYISLLQQKDLAHYDLKSIRMCFSGSAPLPHEIFKRFHEVTGAAILEGYGLTEASPITHFMPPGTEGTRERSIGIPFPGTDARIVDMEAGSLTLEPEKKGELVVRGPQVMKGYLNNPDETASAIRNGWLYTGDIAVMDKDGFFYIVDRKKDMIIVGGYNVFPREVDEVLLEHPKILEAVSVGFDDPLRGEVLKAYIVPKPGETINRSEIVSFCRARLASYKVPRHIEFRDSLPRSLVGKILRRYLREEEEAKRRQAEEKKSSQ
ncbi:MAG: long-chain fatty acid--CoA ligase [Desulfovibrionaceae bacterium]|nr:long-chain fatty acid--CoA ligase [Desulfovibrionaceae bacterium]